MEVIQKITERVLSYFPGRGAKEYNLITEDNEFKDCLSRKVCVISRDAAENALKNAREKFRRVQNTGELEEIYRNCSGTATFNFEKNLIYQISISDSTRRGVSLVSEMLELPQPEYRKLSKKGRKCQEKVKEK